MAEVRQPIAIPIRDGDLKTWLQECVTDLIRELSPEKVILFGSQAQGTSTENSDIDLLVVLDTREESLSKRYSLVSPYFEPREFPMDVLIMRKADYEAKARNPYDSFMQELLSKGTVLYER